MRNIIVAAILGAFSTVVALLPAQLLVWGLATYHINSGLTGPWLIVLALESIVSGGVGLALQLNKED